MTTPHPDDPAATRPLWKEPPFLAGLVVLLVLVGVIGILSASDDGEAPEIGLPEPRDAPTPTPLDELSPEPSPEASPTPTPTPSPAGRAELPDPVVPELPEEETEDTDVVRRDEPDPVEQTGRRSARTGPIVHDGGLAVIRLAHAGEGEFRVRVVDESGTRLEEHEDEDDGVVADAEGRYAGSRALVLDEGRYRLEIVADGVWGMRWVQPDYVRAPGVPATRSGSGDDVTRPFTVTGSRFDAAWAVDAGDVAVRVINVAGAVVREVDAGDGDTITVRGLAGGIYLLDVRAAGAWRAELR